MLEQIRGKVREVVPGYLILEVEGTGIVLGVHVLFSFSEKVKKGSRVCLHTLLYTHPGGWMLFGFVDRQEREWFERLLEVPRVGVLLARRLLSELSVERLVGAIALEDLNTLTLIKGVGRRTAQRIVSLLKEEALQEIQVPAQTAITPLSEVQLAVEALVQMGMKRRDARIAVEKATTHNTKPTATEIVMWVLRNRNSSSQ